MSSSRALDRAREPAILLVARRKSGKSHTRMRWSNHLPMSPIVNDAVKERLIETGTGIEATAELAEFRVELGEDFMRVIDVPGEIANPHNDQAGRYRENLERVAGRVGGVLLCVPPPALPESDSGWRAGFVQPGLRDVYHRDFQPGEGGTSQPTVPDIEQVRARIDSAIAFCEQSLSGLGVSARKLPFAVQLGFADLVSLGSSAKEHRATQDWLHETYGSIWPDPGEWTDPARVEARMEGYRAIDERISEIFAPIAGWMRKRYPKYDLWFFAASNVDDAVGHRSSAIGLAYLADQVVGLPVLMAERERREEERRKQEAVREEEARVERAKREELRAERARGAERARKQRRARFSYLAAGLTAVSAALLLVITALDACSGGSEGAGSREAGPLSSKSSGSVQPSDAREGCRGVACARGSVCRAGRCEPVSPRRATSP